MPLLAFGGFFFFFPDNFLTMVHSKAIGLFYRPHSKKTFGVIRPENTTVLIFNNHIF